MLDAVTSSVLIPPRGQRQVATIADWRAGAKEKALELIDGELVEKAAPGWNHGTSQGALLMTLGPAFSRAAGGRLPGGWWLLPEVDIQFDDENILRPDVAGWRRERVTVKPSEFPVLLKPDWVCEILSRANARNDLVAKLRGYHRFALAHYWIVDPDTQTLTVHRWSPDGSITALTAQRGERVRAEPFQALEWPVGVLFGDDPDGETAPTT